MSPARSWIVIVETLLYGTVDRISGIFSDDDRRAGRDPFASPVRLHARCREDLASEAARAPISAISAS